MKNVKQLPGESDADFDERLFLAETVAMRAKELARRRKSLRRRIAARTAEMQSIVIRDAESLRGSRPSKLHRFHALLAAFEVAVAAVLTAADAEGRGYGFFERRRGRRPSL
jgi:hypothetical protein